MSALERVRKKFGNLELGACKTSKSPSAGFAGSSSKESEKFLALPADLERRIRAMGKRWLYTEAELDEVMRLAAADPVAWLRAVALDERREAEFRECGILPRADA